MKRIPLTAATLACAFIGWWLPALWQSETLRHASRIPPPLRRLPAMNAEHSLAAQVRRAGSAMAQFQAVVDAVQGRGAGLAFLKGGITGLTCGEAEELAAALAGEEVGRSATDGPTLLRSLKDMDRRGADAALTAWAEENPDAALRTLLTPQGEEFSGGGSILQRLAERDPAKALEALRAAPVGLMLQNGWRAVLAACAEKGPDFALTAIRTAPDHARGFGVNSVLRVLARTDPQGALTWMGALPADLRVDGTVVFQVWARNDPAAALPQWQATNNEAFAGAARYYFDLWAGKDPEAALRWAGKHPSVKTSDFIFSSMQTLARSDPQRAVALLGEIGPEHRSSAIVGIAGRWPAGDFPAAFAWVRGLADERDRDAALVSLANSVRQLPELDRRAYVEAVGPATPAGFGILLELDQTAAIQTFAKLPAKQQGELWKRVGQDLSSHSPGGAAAFLQQMQQENPANAVNVAGEHGKLAASWTHSDPEAAASWVESLPSGEPQKWAALNLVANWSRHDPAAAADWTRRLPPGPARNVAEEQLAANTVRTP